VPGHWVNHHVSARYNAALKMKSKVSIAALCRLLAVTAQSAIEVLPK